MCRTKKSISANIVFFRVWINTFVGLPVTYKDDRITP